MVVKKKCGPFGFEATFFAILHSESLLFGRPGFDSRQLQTLKAHNFVALGPTGSKTTFFERSDLCLLGNRKKIGFAGLLRVLLIGQSTIKLYHKKQIDPERLAQTVFHHIFDLCSFYTDIELLVDRVTEYLGYLRSCRRCEVINMQVK